MPGGTVDPALLPLSNRQSCVLASSIPDLQLGKVRTCNTLRARGWGGGYLLRLFALPVPAVQGYVHPIPQNLHSQDLGIPGLSSLQLKLARAPYAARSAEYTERAITLWQLEGRAPIPVEVQMEITQAPSLFALPVMQKRPWETPFQARGAVQGAGLGPGGWGQGTTEPLLTPSIPTLTADSKLFPLGPCSSYF